ncbi:3-deoxy-manno-octulosonate cytidylyltransferase [Candidatus Babeliales bacterium]|nr:3-deoxy-manno-octulosonate cytidylyltransferase [Candidatus Babeliales bacterium]
MIGNKTVACVIPARLASTRFPNKVIAPLLGKPLLQWVWEATQQVKLFDHVVFAIDSMVTAAYVEAIGAPYIMTSVECPTGTDRLIEVVQQGTIKADIWVLWQCDEPFITSMMIDALLQSCLHDGADMWTLKKRIFEDSVIFSPNVVKVVSDITGKALYFSRSPIPFYREKNLEQFYYQHIGIYAYTPAALERIACFKQTPLELAESIEVLRSLQHGLKIGIHETVHDAAEVNTYEDMLLAEQYAQTANLR